MFTGKKSLVELAPEQKIQFLKLEIVKITAN